MSKAKLREVHGLLHNGERVFLGSARMTDDEVQNFTEGLARSYGDSDCVGAFRIRSSVFSARAFAGVDIAPPTGTAN